jgi:hypothetical protein
VKRLLLAALTLPCAAQTVLRLPNGLNATLLERHDSPLLRVELRLPVEDADLPKNLPGLPTLFLRVWLAGPAGRRSPEAFASVLEQNGMRLSTRVEHGGLRLSLLARSSDQELAFGLLGDLLLRPSLEHGPLEAERQRLYQDTALRGAAELEEARLRAQEGPEAPPTEQSFSTFTLADLEAFKARVLRPERVRMAIAGDLLPSQARQALLLGLGSWAPPAPPSEPPRLGAAQAAADPKPGLLALPIPEARMRPLLALLLQGVLPALRGEGRPGHPWILPAASKEALAAAAARKPDATALSRAKVAWAASQVLEGLDPEARLREVLDPPPRPEEVQSVSLEEAQAAWARLLAP